MPRVRCRESGVVRARCPDSVVVRVRRRGPAAVDPPLGVRGRGCLSGGRFPDRNVSAFDGAVRCLRWFPGSARGRTGR